MDAQDIQAYVSRRSNKALLGPPYRFYHYLDKDERVIGAKSIRPLQFPLGKLPTMSSLLDKHGIGWDSVNVYEYFKLS